MVPGAKINSGKFGIFQIYKKWIWARRPRRLIVQLRYFSMAAPIFTIRLHGSGRVLWNSGPRPGPAGQWGFRGRPRYGCSQRPRCTGFIPDCCIAVQRRRLHGPPKRMQIFQLLLRMGLLPGWVGIRHEKYLQQGRVDVQEVVGDVGSQKAGGEVLGPQEIFLLQQPDQVEHTKFLEHGPR